MRFMKAVSHQLSAKARTSTRPLLLTADSLIERPSWPIRSFFALEWLLRDTRRLFSGAEHALFISADTFVGMQAFKRKLGSGNLGFGTILWSHVYASQLVHQALNVPQ